MKKRIKYFYRRYKKELFSTVVTIILTIISLCISNIKISLFLSLVFIFLGLIVTIYFYLKEKDFFYVSFKRREDKDDWAGEGHFEYFRIDKGYMIKNSYSGFIFQKIFSWTDYRVSFDFQITNKCLGVILRAMNLSNYIMMQINCKGTRPHLRINGGWLIREAEQEGLVFRQDLSKNTWYRCEILCDKRMICIKIIDKNKLIVDQKWAIPSGAVPFVFGDGSAKITIPFPIDLEYGTVGFRSDGDESALVRDLLVEKI